MFFDDAISDKVFSTGAYAAHTGRDTMNANDSIFQSGGQQGLVTLAQTANGYAGTAMLGIQV